MNADLIKDKLGLKLKSRLKLLKLKLKTEVDYWREFQNNEIMAPNMVQLIFNSKPFN